MEGQIAPTITRLLQKEGVKVSHVGIFKFLAKFEETCSIGRIKHTIWQTIEITAETKTLVEDQMHSDVETTVYQHHKLLISKYNRTYISLRTVLFLLIENKLPNNLCNCQTHCCNHYITCLTMCTSITLSFTTVDIDIHVHVHVYMHPPCGCQRQGMDLLCICLIGSVSLYIYMCVCVCISLESGCKCIVSPLIEIERVPVHRILSCTTLA